MERPLSKAHSLTPNRFLQVDAFRAFALFGLFIVHCVELFELHWADPQPSVWFDRTFLVFAGKAFAMFALSFGLSFSIIISRAQHRGEAYEARFLWRSIILILFGLAHTMIYRGDILVVLGLVGLLLVPFNRFKSNAILIAVAMAFLINVPLILRYLFIYDGGANGLAVLTKANTLSMQAYASGGLMEFFVANLGSGNLVKWVYMLESGRVSQIFGLFLLGLVLGRINFFTDLSRFQIHRWALAILLGSSAFFLYQNQSEVIEMFPKSAHGETQFYVSNLVAGWSNILFMFFQTLVFFELWLLLKGRVLNWLAPLGRMSLTLYIGQSIVFIPLLYNVGLGFYDDVTAEQMFWIGIVAFAAQGVFAAVWVRCFYYGPLEWLWRAFTKQSTDVPFRRAS